MAKINEGADHGRAGDREKARMVLSEVWDQLGPDGDPLHVVSLAHYMADLQDNPADELEWDRRALAAAGSLTDERARRYHASLAVGGFYPSLYLNLAADHLKLDEPETAGAYLVKAEAATSELPEDEYGDSVRAAIARLRDQLDESGRSGSGMRSRGAQAPLWTSTRV